MTTDPKSKIEALLNELVSLKGMIPGSFTNEKYSFKKANCSLKSVAYFGCGSAALSGFLYPNCSKSLFII